MQTHFEMKMKSERYEKKRQKQMEIVIRLSERKWENRKKDKSFAFNQKVMFLS